MIKANTLPTVLTLCSSLFIYLTVCFPLFLALYFLLLVSECLSFPPSPTALSGLNSRPQGDDGVTWLPGTDSPALGLGCLCSSKRATTKVSPSPLFSLRCQKLNPEPHTWEVERDPYPRHCFEPVKKFLWPPSSWLGDPCPERGMLR